MNRPAFIVLKGAAFTVLTLFGGMLAGVVMGSAVTDMLPNHGGGEPSALYVILGVVPALSGLLIGSASWGIFMGRLAGGQRASRRRLAVAGVLGFVPTTLVLGVGLFGVEQIVTASAQLPIHRVFTVLFVPAAFLIAGISAWALGRALGGTRKAWRLLWRVGLAAALAFLLVNMVMEAAGWVVGAPGAAQRDTMITVLMVGNLGAALAGGGIVGLSLGRWKLKNG